MLAGCSSRPEPRRSIATPSPAPIAIDWGELASLDPIDVDGVTLEDCPGDAPLLCVTREGRDLGSIELNRFPREEGQTLESLAAEHETTFTKDRREGCPAGYTVAFTEPRRLTVAGLDGIRSDFKVGDANGQLGEFDASVISGLVPVIDRIAAGSVPPEGEPF